MYGEIDQGKVEEEEEEIQSVSRGLNLLLLALLLEEEGHEPKDARDTKSWKWRSADSQQGSGDFSPTATRN